MTPTTPTGWLALCIWDEARNQIDDGKAAVGRVVLNRARIKFQSDGTVQGTVLHPCAFSGFWFDMVDGKYTRVAHTLDDAMARAADKLDAARKSPTLWASILDIAQDVVDRTYHGPDYDKLTDDTLNYANLEISHPVWATNDKFVAKIGAHSFYRN